MILASVVVGCPGMPFLLQWFMGWGGLLHVLGAGVVLVVAWERVQDHLRSQAAE